jgi:hypothetical protein
MQNLGSITNLEKMTGVKVVAEDSNGNPVPNFNGTPSISADIGGVAISNVQATADLPANSTFTFDITATGVSDGPVTLTVQGSKGPSLPLFTADLQITVTQDPSLPGLPVTWVATPGVISAQVVVQ